MSESKRETLSAMLDNETDELELRRLLKTAGGDTELMSAWERYSLAQAVLHEPHLARLSNDFQSELAQRLSQEPAPGRGIGAFSLPRQFAGKFAIAATVAVAVFIGLQSGLDNGPAAPQQIAIEEIAPAPVIAAGPLAVDVSDGPAAPVDPVARQRLLEYIESMRFDPSEPPRMEHIQDSPLFHLVNDLQD